jgi:N-acetylglucosaminyl-diphospho-decaprenol L-rhamnosyltransferase
LLKDKIRIAVVIVNYRTASLVIRCLHTLQAERVADQENQFSVVVVDNDSGDFEAISKALQRHQWLDWVNLVKAPRNGGFGYGNNLGFQFAREGWGPEYVHFLNPDTEVRPGAIQALADFLSTSPRAAFAGSRFVTEDGSPWPYAFRFPGLLSEIEQGLSFGPVTRLLSRHVVAKKMRLKAERVDWVSGASFMARASAFEELGGFDEGYFLYFEETDLCLRASRAGWETWYVPESHVMHALGKSTGMAHNGQKPNRLPSYWFESRRRYFLLNHGFFKSLIIDLFALVAYALGTLKRVLQCKRGYNTPSFLFDLLRHSVLLNLNLALSSATKARANMNAPIKPY